MNDYCLVFSDRTQALSVLGALDSTQDRTVLDIGAYLQGTGDIDEDGNPVTEAVPGYHVNVRSRYPIAELSEYTVEPLTPSHGWAE